MPSHIFNRLGMWSRSSASNHAAMAAADHWNPEPGTHDSDYTHALSTFFFWLEIFFSFGLPPTFNHDPCFPFFKNRAGSIFLFSYARASRFFIFRAFRFSFLPRAFRGFRGKYLFFF
jgi:hypothetical protein